jgi:hypothetical protein
MNGNLDGAIEVFAMAEKIDANAIAGNRYIAESYSNRGFKVYSEQTRPQLYGVPYLS